MEPTQEWIPVTKNGEKTGYELHFDASNRTYELYDKSMDLCYPEIDSHNLRYRGFDQLGGVARYYLPVKPSEEQKRSREPHTDKGIFVDVVQPMPMNF